MSDTDGSRHDVHLTGVLTVVLQGEVGQVEVEVSVSDREPQSGVLPD